MRIAKPEIRAIVVAAYCAGTASRKQLSDIFGYHIETIGRWIRCAREERLTPLPRGHRISVFNSEELEQLAAFIKKTDATLAEIHDHFGKSCSLPAIHKIIRKIGYVFKKTLKASEQKREDTAKSREEWREFQVVVDANHLVFLDESGLKTNMTRRYGCAHRGLR
jgi:transposase